MGQYERMPEQDAREAALLAGPRGRELCARLARIDVVGEEAVREIEVPAVVAVDPSDEMFGIRELAEVAEGACYWGSYPAGADPLADPALKPAMREGAALLAGAEGCRWWWSGIARAAQAYVQWTARDTPAPVLGQAAEKPSWRPARWSAAGRSC